METFFKPFLGAFPKTKEDWQPVDKDYLENWISKEFQVPTPQVLLEFWSEVGSGYFGNRAIYFFGDGKHALPFDSLTDWNKKDYWQDLFPDRAQEGPIFFAETCFGEQIGFRWEGGHCVPLLFVVDSFDLFTLAESMEALFSEILVDIYPLMNPELLNEVNQLLGPVPRGMHYAPIISPLVGGSDNPRNFHVESPNVHFRTAIATYFSLKRE